MWARNTASRPGTWRQPGPGRGRVGLSMAFTGCRKGRYSSVTTMSATGKDWLSGALSNWRVFLRWTLFRNGRTESRPPGLSTEPEPTAAWRGTIPAAMANGRFLPRWTAPWGRMRAGSPGTASLASQSRRRVCLWMESTVSAAWTSSAKRLGAGKRPPASPEACSRWANTGKGRFRSGRFRAPIRARNTENTGWQPAWRSARTAGTSMPP